MKLKIPGKAFLKSESQISVTSYSFWPYLPTTGSGWDLASTLPWKNCKKHFLYFSQFLNVTEVWDSDFKNAFPGIFNFTVGILASKNVL